MSSVGLDRDGGRLPTLPALDGIRAIAIAGVLLYHSDIFWFPGGLLGVEVFFVLSGYLITSILWNELLAEGRIDIPIFLKRRARRLFPALFVMLAVACAVWVIWYPQEVARVRGDVAAAATYTSNWYMIHGDHSYFTQFARPSPFGHLWSLAIEEQFYLLWPPILFGLFVWLKKPARVARAVLAGAGVSAIALSFLYHADGDASRIYFGTDTRAAGLLIGSALALVWRPYALTGWSERHADKPWLLDMATVVSGAIIVWAFMRFEDTSSWTYRPGLLVVSLATASLIASAVHPNARLGRVLGVRPMRWLGKRSYSIYIWYFPVFALTRPGVDNQLSIGTAFLVRLAITLTLAEFSYRWVEQPIRNGALGRLIRSVRERGRLDGSLRRKTVLGLSAAGSVALILASSLAVAMAAAVPPPRNPSASSTGLGRPEEITPVNLGLGPNPRIVAVGDSVMVGAKPQLRERFATIRIDAKVARQVSEGINRLKLMRRRGQLGDAVIIHLGNNGKFTTAQFEEIMGVLTGVKNLKRIVFVNVKVPRRWEASVNRVLVAGVRRHPGVKYVNWRHEWRSCSGRVFGSDATHLTPAGARCYARMLAGAL